MMREIGYKIPNVPASKKAFIQKMDACVSDLGNKDFLVYTPFKDNSQWIKYSFWEVWRGLPDIGYNFMTINHHTQNFVHQDEHHTIVTPSNVTRKLIENPNTLILAKIKKKNLPGIVMANNKSASSFKIVESGNEWDAILQAMLLNQDSMYKEFQRQKNLVETTYRRIQSMAQHPYHNISDSNVESWRKKAQENHH